MVTESVEAGKDTSFTGREVLTETYNRLQLEFPSHTELQFEDPPLSVVENVDGYFRYTIFDRAFTVDIQTQRWIIAIATKTKGNLTGTVSGELKIFNVNSKVAVTPGIASQAIDESSFQRNAFIVVSTSGELLIPTISTKNVEMSKTLGKEISSTQLAANLPSQEESLIRYGPKIVEVLIKAIKEKLEPKASKASVQPQ